MPSWRSQRDDQPAGFGIASLVGQLAQRIASEGWLARLEQAASQLLAKEVGIGQELPTARGGAGPRSRAPAAPAGSDSWTRDLASQSSPTGLVPAGLGQQPLGLSIRFGEPVQPEKDLLEADPRLEVVRVEQHCLLPLLLIARLSF